MEDRAVLLHDLEHVGAGDLDVIDTGNGAGDDVNANASAKGKCIIGEELGRRQL